jgi:hypothetical protein
MADPQTGSVELHASGRPETLSTWIVTILAFAYVAWTGFSLYRSTAAFSNLYNSLDVELWGPTWFLIRNYHWFYPSLFGGASALVITKQFFVREKWISLMITLTVAVVVGFIGSGIVWALYRPVNDLVEKLK